MGGLAGVCDRVRVTVLFLREDYAFLCDPRRAEQRAPVSGPIGKDGLGQFVGPFHARLGLIRLPEIKVSGNALNASHAPVAVSDVLAQVQITVSGRSQAIQVFQSSREQK